jgi:hypothetical protein
MNDLITEARELCEKATPGKWHWEGELLLTDAEQFLVLKPYYDDDTDNVSTCVMPYDAAFIARSRTLIPELCDALEKANAQIESIHKSLDFAETQRQKSKNYTELAINNGLALGRIAVTIQHDFGPLPAPPEEGE